MRRRGVSALLQRGQARLDAVRARKADDGGNAVVEFLGVTLILMVPTVYLILVLSTYQAASFAVEGAAREAGRVLSAGPQQDGVAQRAVASVALALSDQGLDELDPAAALQFVCADACGPGDKVTVAVRTDVPLPGVPGFVQSTVPLSVSVGSTHVVTVDPFGDLQ